MAEQLDYVARVREAYEESVAEHRDAMLIYATELGNGAQDAQIAYDNLTVASNRMWMAATRLAAYL